MLRTRARSEATGTEIRVNGGAVASVREVGTPEGTSIEIADLFYNLPARRKFLKSDTAESTQISPPDDADGTRVSVGRVHADERHANAPPVPPANGLGERFFQLFGERPDLIEVRKEAGGLKLQGYIAALGDQGPGMWPAKRLRQPAHRQGPHHCARDRRGLQRRDDQGAQPGDLFIEIPRTAST